MKNSLLVLLFFLILGWLTKADGGDALRSTGFDLSGSWDVLEEVNADNCGTDAYTQEYKIEIDHVDDMLTVKTPNATFTGYIHGGIATWSGQYTDNGGTIRIYSEIVFSEDGLFFEGTETWNWENGSDLCVGSGSLSGSRYDIYSSENSENSVDKDNLSKTMGCFINGLLKNESHGQHPGKRIRESDLSIEKMVRKA